MKDSNTQAAPDAHVHRTRISSAWVASIAAAVVLILLLVFIIQNSQRVSVSFLGAHGQLPLGVALLLAAASGILLVAVPGTARIVQLRRAARKAAATPPPSPAVGPAETEPGVPDTSDNSENPPEQNP
jgi:uncharacterized integral membrane protein